MPRRIVTLMWLVLAPSALASAPAAPPALEVTAEEQVDLAAGGLVVRLDKVDEGTRTVAVIDIAAPPATVLAAVLDLDPRVDEVGSLQAVQVYSHAAGATPEQMGVRWDLKVVGRSVTFHTLYTIARDEAWCAWTLDPSQENDIPYSVGSYRAFRTEVGSRLVYRSTADAGVSVPIWLRKWLTSGSLKDQMTGIKARAEQGRGGSAM